MPDFVERWDELIDWDGRAASEGRFFIDVLKRPRCHSVIDAACGTGFHSVQRLRTGFDVASVEGDVENTPYPDAHFDVVWSQKAMLHSGDRPCMLDEAVRVLKPGGASYSPTR